MLLLVVLLSTVVPPHFKELVSLTIAANISGQRTVDILVADTCGYHSNAQDILGVKIGVIPW